MWPPLPKESEQGITAAVYRFTKQKLNWDYHQFQSHLSELVCLGFVGPDCLGFCPIQSFSPFRLSAGFNKHRSSSSREDSSHWTRHSGARAMFSLISNGANFPHAAASVWNDKGRKHGNYYTGGSWSQYKREALRMQTSAKVAHSLSSIHL